MSDDYARYRALIAAERLPCALVDLDAVDHNLAALRAPVQAAGKTLRVASKSLRCMALLRYLLERGEGVLRGVMAYAVAEAAHLCAHGQRDVLVAYPSVQAPDLADLVRLNQSGAVVSLVVDDPAQVDRVAAAGRAAGVKLPLVVEVDMSYRPLGGAAHLGVRRSPLRTGAAVAELAARIAETEGARFHGVMGYEAQIAGMGENNPFTRLMNPGKRLVKALSAAPVRDLRAEVAAAVRARGLELPLFNGGGTGSVAATASEPAVTEVTAGSGFVCSHLFDYYDALALRPALFFALQVVRRSDPGYATCHGGGFIASGEPGLDRLPRPWLPRGLALTALEAAGEVQTPLRVPPGVALQPGDPVFFRHAKAGELAEHFTHYLLIRGDRVVERVPTYRGEGHAFLG